MTTDKLFFTLFGDAITSPDRDAFVSDWSLSSVWGDAPDADIPADRIETLGQLWDAADSSAAIAQTACWLLYVQMDTASMSSRLHNSSQESYAVAFVQPNRSRNARALPGMMSAPATTSTSSNDWYALACECAIPPVPIMPMRNFSAIFCKPP